MHLLIDSTGLKLFGKGEWDGERHGRAGRSWRKLHIAVDAETGEIIASVLTGKEAGDAGQVPVLLNQIEGEIASVVADGARAIAFENFGCVSGLEDFYAALSMGSGERCGGRISVDLCGFEGSTDR